MLSDPRRNIYQKFIKNITLSVSVSTYWYGECIRLITCYITTRNAGQYQLKTEINCADTKIKYINKRILSRNIS